MLEVLTAVRFKGFDWLIRKYSYNCVYTKLGDFKLGVLGHSLVMQDLCCSRSEPQDGTLVPCKGVWNSLRVVW